MNKKLKLFLRHIRYDSEIYLPILFLIIFWGCLFYYALSRGNHSYKTYSKIEDVYYKLTDDEKNWGLDILLKKYFGEEVYKNFTEGEKEYLINLFKMCYEKWNVNASDSFGVILATSDSFSVILNKILEESENKIEKGKK